MYIVKNNDDGRRWATIAIYRECQRKHSGQTGHHVVDGCLEFLGYRDDHRSEVAFYCSKCGCNRNFHRKEEISILIDPTTVQMVHKSATARPPPHCKAPSPPPRQVSIPKVRIRNGEAEQEETSEQKRKRTKFTEEQKEAMREYAESSFRDEEIQKETAADFQIQVISFDGGKQRAEVVDEIREVAGTWGFF
ncbi:hypothetical protein RHSIM_Rhsim11G0126000 [Rhododendron simsii]|uniref:ZF-HD dimerization-type domain-containing protein n=1 Tax=Rhododendron simsii TaxID=118357 RepID=A0A834G8M6_RHOSS|nr:hypothetical protein RHSIM_Rhsim11G0126000 [Rhododendron simsii]